MVTHAGHVRHATYQSPAVCTGRKPVACGMTEWHGRGRKTTPWRPIHAHYEHH